jgi:hypothetical protein
MLNSSKFNFWDKLLCKKQYIKKIIDELNFKLTFAIHLFQMKKILTITFLFVLIHIGTIAIATNSKLPTISNDSIRPFIYTGFEKLYNFEFKSTDSCIQQLKKDYGYSSWTYILEANYFWWKIISGEKNDTYINSFYGSLDNAKKYVNRLNCDEKKFLSILIYSFQARVDLMDEKYLNTIVELKKHIHIIKTTFEKEDSYHAYYLTSGLYYYLTSVAYSNYSLLRSIMFFMPKGDKLKGIRFLNKKSGDIVLETESQYFLMKIFDEVEHRDDLSIKYASVLCKKYPQNFIFQEQYYKLLARTRKAPLTSNELRNTKKTILRNKQLSKAQQNYFINITKKLLACDS